MAKKKKKQPEKPTHGGARPNSGRRSAFPDVPLANHSIRIPQALIDLLGTIAKEQGRTFGRVLVEQMAKPDPRITALARRLLAETADP